MTNPTNGNGHTGQPPAETSAPGGTLSLPPAATAGLRQLIATLDPLSFWIVEDRAVEPGHKWIIVSLDVKPAPEAADLADLVRQGSWAAALVAVLWPGAGALPLAQCLTEDHQLYLPHDVQVEARLTDLPNCLALLRMRGPVPMQARLPF